MSSTFGDTDPDFTSWYLSEENTENQVGSYIGDMPEDGYVTLIKFYAGGYSTSPKAQGVLWDEDGNVICSGDAIDLPDEGGDGVGDQSWNASTVDNQLITAGTPLYGGWWRDPSKDCVWSVAPGSSEATSDDETSPHSLSGAAGMSGAIGVYIEYTPASLPTATTDAATDLDSGGATLNGKVNPNGLDTTCYFEYGETTAYGSQIPATPVDEGSGTSSVSISEALSGLSAGVWHFQLVASNDAGDAYGGDMVFVIVGDGSGSISLAGAGASPLPTVSVNSPSGANTAADPTVGWTVTVPTDQKIVSSRCVIYSADQVGAGGFDPGSGANVWDSGTISGSALAATPIGVPNFGNFFAYVQVTTSLGLLSEWAYIEWTQAVGIVAVEIGFPSTPDGDNFVLNSATQGKLNGDTYTLGGTDWVDVTHWCSAQITVTRGRSRETDQYTTGEAGFTLRNEDRRFDPLNTDSPYYPGIVPRAPVNIYVGGIQVFGGYVSDYNPGYDKPNTATVKVTAQDAFSILANAYINNWTATEELTGQRILDLISANVPGFPADMSIAQGNTLLQANLFGANSVGSDGDVALDDLQTVASSEWGFLFCDRTGRLTFLDRYAIIRQLAAATVYAAFSDDADDIADGAFGYFGISLLSAVLLLFNQVQGTRNSDQLDEDDEPITQIANDEESQQAYLLKALQLPSIENYSDADVLSLCNWVLSLYSQPEVRFDKLVLELTGMTVAQLQQLASLDIPQVCTVKRTPPGSGSPASIKLMSYVDQIGWDFDVSASTYRLNFSFGSAEILNYFVLNNPTYGVLNTSELAY